LLVSYCWELKSVPFSCFFLWLFVDIMHGFCGLGTTWRNSCLIYVFSSLQDTSSSFCIPQNVYPCKILQVAPVTFKLQVPLCSCSFYFKSYLFNKRPSSFHHNKTFSMMDVYFQKMFWSIILGQICIWNIWSRLVYK
jgi:hypothetical protein